MIDAKLREVFVRRLSRREQVFGHTAAKVPAVWLRQKQVKVSRNRRVQCHRPCRQNTLPSILVRHGSDSADSESFDQPFISAKEKGLIASNRSAERSTELISLK